MATADGATPSVASEGGRRQYLTFMLGRETFALGILAIREIIQYSVPTDVPMVPPHIRGVINLRGAVVPVIDLSAWFGRGIASVARRTCILVIELSVKGRAQTLGVIVDSVTKVVWIADADIEPPPAFGGAVRTEFIAGLGKAVGRFVVILDPDRVFGMEALRDASVAAAAAAPAAA